jgi:hypothetical protein
MRIVLKYLAVEECSTGDFVFVSMVIQLSLFGVVFDSGATTVGSSPLLAMLDEHWVYTQSIVGVLSYYHQTTKCEKNVQIEIAYPLHCAGISGSA